MSALFEIQINNMLTVNEDGLSEVVKFIQINIIGTESGQTFSLPGVIEMPNPNPDDFTPYQDLTQQQVIDWLQVNEQVLAMEAQIQYVLNKQVAEAQAQNPPLPWNPQPTPPAP